MDMYSYQSSDACGPLQQIGLQITDTSFVLFVELVTTPILCCIGARNSKPELARVSPDIQVNDAA